MTTDQAPRQHAYTGPALPVIAEPSHAERVRTLAAQGSTATLCTLSKKQPGFPFGSLMPYALDAVGRPLFLISNMAMHTHNLRADSRCSLFLTQTATEGEVLGAARATLVGEAHPVPEAALEAARDAYLARHENSRNWVAFSDFHFFRLNPVDVYYVGGFGVMGWVTADDYMHAEPDPLMTSAAGIVSHMNADHEANMIQLAKMHARIDATAAAMTSVDRLGFTLRLTTVEGMKGARINYPEEARTAQDVRTQLVNMVRTLPSR